MLSKYFQKKIALHNPHRPNTRGKNEWLLPSQCDGGNFNHLHHNVVMVTIILKWSPSSHWKKSATQSITIPLTVRKDYMQTLAMLVDLSTLDKSTTCSQSRVDATKRRIERILKIPIKSTFFGHHYSTRSRSRI